MLEVVYFDLGTHILQAMPQAYFVHTLNHAYVERLWGFESFELIDVGANRDFMAMTCNRKIERGNRYVATVHWDEQVPPRLKYAPGFWVGPMHKCIDLLGSCREVRHRTDAEFRCPPTTPTATTFSGQPCTTWVIDRSPKSTRGFLDRAGTISFPD